MSLRLSSVVSALLWIVRRPAIWLILQIAIATWLVSIHDGLTYRRVADTKSYVLAADSASVGEALGNYRTYGYPFFLTFFRVADDSILLTDVPRVELTVFFASVLVFWWGMKRFSGNGWLALAAASPLLFAPALILLPRIQPDFFALPFVLLAFAFLMLLLERRSTFRWIGLTLAVFISYQLRPAGVFLIALLPALGGIWCWIRDRAAFRKALAFAGVLAICTLAPLITFAALRWATVGHFGVVSFGGCNASAMAICFLDNSLVNEMPTAQRALARALLRGRQRRGFEPMTAKDDPELFFDQYSDNLFRISLGAMRSRIRRETLAAGTQAGLRDGLPVTWPVQANRALRDLASEILSRRPGLYLNWITASVNYGLRQVRAWEWIAWPFFLLVVSIPLAVFKAREPADHRGVDAELRARSLACFTIGAVGFFCTYIGLIALVSFPFERYFVSAAILLPSLLLALLFETWSKIVAPTTGDATS